jgi:uncharacterized membrane protein HdeD (DUF308 family)
MKKHIRYVALWGVGITVGQNVYRGISLSSMVWVVLLVFIAKKTLAEPPQYPKRIGAFLGFCAVMQGVLLYLYVSKTGIHADRLWSSLITTTLPLVISAVAFFYIGTRKRAEPAMIAADLKR